MKALVTGGAGFIGSHIAERLQSEGHEVHVLDDLSLGKEGNVPPGTTFHHASVLDDAALREAMAGAAWVFHEAALPSVPRSIENPASSHEVNATGTLRVLLAAREAKVQKVVFAASSSAYGDTEELPKHEGMPTRPRSPYAVSKVTGEQYCQVFHQVYGLRTTALRYFNVYGPRQDPNGAYAAVIPRFITAARQGEPLRIHGDGEQTRDFTFVADVVDANLLAAASAGSDGLVLNVGAGGRTSLNELAREILGQTGSRSTVLYGPPRQGDVRDSVAALERAERAMGYKPKVTLREGIARTLSGW